MTKTETTPSKVRWAVVGQGYFSQVAILPAFAHVENSVLTALFSDDDTKLAALKSKYDVEHVLRYEQYDEFLRSGAVDAVYLALPNDMHCEFTERAAMAGVHVLCEKPMAVSVEECRRMITACETAQVKLMIGYRLHFDEAHLRVIDLVSSWAIGDPRAMTSLFSMPVREGNIRTQREHGGGPLFDIGIYCINAARCVFQAEPVEVVAFKATRPSDKRFNEVEEQVGAVLRFPGDRIATFASTFGGADVNDLRVVGTDGWIRLDPAFEFATPLRMETMIGGKHRKKRFRRHDQVAPEIEHFADCVLNDRQPEPSGQEGLADVAIVEAIYQSASSGRPVSVDLPSRRPGPIMGQARKMPASDAPTLVDAAQPSDS
jgi:glucose-fructose oxidoreductase